MTRKVFVFEILLIAAALVATVVVYPHLPAQVPVHWNIHSQPDGYGPRWTLYLFGPGFMAAFMLLMWALPWLSPKRFGIDSFWHTYLQMNVILFLMYAYIFAALLWACSGRAIDMGRAISCGICFFFILIGNLLGKLRRNFYVGVKTPWTLASERVWNATHRFAAKTFVIGALIGLALSIAGHFFCGIIAVVVGSLVPVLYSLVIYKQLERRGEL
jgi:uncharacterized membrane protein